MTGWIVAALVLAYAMASPWWPFWMGRMIDHKHTPRRKEPTVPNYLKPRFEPIFCRACRIVILCPIGWNDRITPPPAPWIAPGPEAHGFFCSEECKQKGLPIPARQPAPSAHIDWERGSKPSPDRQLGREDALTGFDCIGHRPEYVKGHGEGMAMRDILFAAVEKLRGPS